MSKQGFGVPLVSIVTPAFNSEHLIKDTIDSVLSQTFDRWELIVIDDCSTDGTADVVSRYVVKDARIHLEVLPKNFGGPAGPRNIGISRARGKYIAFLDSDDIWHPKKLELQVALIEKTGAKFVCSRIKDFVRRSDIQFLEPADFSYEAVTFCGQSIRAQIPTSSVLVDKTLFEQHRFIDDIQYKAVEDYDCWLKILRSVPYCLKINEALVFYRKVEGQISGSKLYMAKKVFMVHRRLPGRSLGTAIFLTISHILGGVYFRFLKKGM